MRINKELAKKIGDKLKINYEVVPFEEWHYALNVELEHGSRLGQMVNITKDDPLKTAKIALAHLIEDPRYYKFLKSMETKREKYWENKTKPDIFLFAKPKHSK